MRIGCIVLMGILILAFATGCAGGPEVQVRPAEGNQATAPAATESVTPFSTPELTPLPEKPTAASPASSGPAAPTATAGQGLPTAQPAQAEAPTAPPTSKPATAVAPPPPTKEPPPVPTEVPLLLDEAFTFDPDAWQASLSPLGSFRQKVTLDFTADGSGAHSRAVYDGEATTDPAALHSTLRVEGEAASQLPANQVELIWIGDQAWIRVGRTPWVPVSAGAMESEFAGQAIGVGDLLPFVEEASRVRPNETVNGIECEHYTYDLGNLETEAGMTTAQGDIWVAEDGGYVVRLTMNGQGTYYGTYGSSGTLELVYDLFDVNTPITIKPPR
jgi:hypothetical protein